MLKKVQPKKQLKKLRKNLLKKSQPKKHLLKHHPTKRRPRNPRGMEMSQQVVQKSFPP